VYDVELCIMGPSNACSGRSQPPETPVGWNIGAGVSRGIGPHAVVFVEARYFNHPGIDSFIGRTVKPTFLSLTAGMKW
jgi:hypothetical protein